MRLLTALLALALMTGLSTGQDNELRRHLDLVYTNWRNALVTHDMSAWQRATAAHRQMLTRNLIVSQKQPFPEALFAMPIQPPETRFLRFLGVVANGNTASMAYFGKVDLGIAEPTQIPETVLILKFVREATGWKFDTTRLLNLSSAPEVLETLKNGGQATFLNDPEFAPTGEIPAVPKACPSPDRVGVLQIVSFGYETKASVNGFEAATVRDNQEDHLVIGGLRNGGNPLVLEVKETPVPPEAERLLEVSAVVLTGEQERPSVQVFIWKAPAGSITSPVNLMISVSRHSMK